MKNGGKNKIVDDLIKMYVYIYIYIYIYICIKLNTVPLLIYLLMETFIHFLSFYLMIEISEEQHLFKM